MSNNSYLTVEEAQELADERLNVDAWEDADVADQGKALIMATQAIDRLNYRGDKTDEDQELQFPRGGDEEVPVDIKRACFEIAVLLLDGLDPQLEGENLGMIAQGYANVRATYDRELPMPHISAGIYSIVAWRCLVPYLRDPYSVELIRQN